MRTTVSSTLQTVSSRMGVLSCESVSGVLRGAWVLPLFLFGPVWVPAAVPSPSLLKLSSGNKHWGLGGCSCFPNLSMTLSNHPSLRIEPCFQASQKSQLFQRWNSFSCAHRQGLSCSRRSSLSQKLPASTWEPGLFTDMSTYAVQCFKTYTFASWRQSI